MAVFKDYSGLKWNLEYADYDSVKLQCLLLHKPQAHLPLVTSSSLVKQIHAWENAIHKSQL